MLQLAIHHQVELVPRYSRTQFASAPGARCPMHARITNFTPALLVFLLLAAGCSDNGGVATGGSGLAGPGSVFSTRVTAEPLTIRPEFLSSPFCRTEFP